MTIVLQNQFWGLKVSDDRFEVSLTFQKLPAALVIPFASLTAFVDPGVQFGLQFRNSDAAKKASASREATKASSVPTVPAAKPAPAKASQDAAAPKQPSTESPAGPQVVSIDKFRKK